jgi:hypothetical protein
MTVTVQGADRLRRKLNQLPDAYQREIFLAFEQGAEDATRMMRGLVPTDTGALKASIGWTWGEAPSGSMRIGGLDHSPPNPDSPDADKRITISAGDAKAYYARWVEFGTLQRPAQPYFFPSWRSVRKSVQSRNRRAMSKVARKVAAGGN